MSLSTDFNTHADFIARPARKGRKKAAAPFSIRLSSADRNRLAEEAGGMPLATYLRAKVLNGPPLKDAAGCADIEDERKAIARILARLGGSNLAASLSELASAVRSGSLVINPETEQALRAAHAELADIRRLLMRALGVKAGTS